MASMDLGQFGAEVVLDTSKFDKGMSNVDGKMKKSEGGMKSFGGKMGKMAAGAIAGISAAAVGAGAAGIAMANKFSDSADRIDKTSMKLGISTDAFQELEFAMGQVGVNSGTMEKSIGRLNQRLADTDGNEKYRTAIQDLGVATEDASGKTRDADEVFMETIQSLHEVGDSTEQAALAQEIFGTKTARELMPAIQAGGDSIADLRDEAHELGAVIGEDGVESGVLWADTVDKMKNMAQGLFNSIAVELLPVFQNLVDWVIANMPQIQATMKTVFSVIKTVIGTGIEWVQRFISWLKNWINDNQSTLDTIKTGFQDFFNLVKDLFKGFVTLAKNIWKNYGEDLLAYAKNTFNNIKTIISGVLNVIKGIIKTVTGIITGDWSKAWEGVKQILSGAWDIIKGVVNQGINLIKTYINIGLKAVRSVFSSIWNGIKSVVSSVISNIVSNVSSKFNSMKSRVSSIFNGIKSIASSVFNRVKSAITSPVEKAVSTVKNLVGKIKGAFDFDWSLPKLKLPKVNVTTKKNSLGIPIPKFDIDWHKNGGFFDSPSVIGVGEAGKEAVVPLVGKQMNPFADAVYKRLANNMNKGNTTNNNNNTNNTNNNFSVNIEVSGSNTDADEIYDTFIDNLKDLGVRF
ncbi:hypothetical protein MUN88_17020 [Gracilibacillus caseinilyticus]|uniref:Phage-related protein n=1 Tax=Gracilibacillus caseinilyticus TaxID=2932256 RepID=A0ABY4ETY6_9BACI|nr:hypothetical protein [Gracilibacillus caseinilyticus]UOQ47734.1 hypothetical protein MUN88_17020 [Gracilibacillus caseinilyticus]